MASIRKRSENSYQITVSCGYDSKGKKIIKTRTVTLDEKLTEKHREKELQKIALEFERSIETGQYLDGGKLTFSEFIEKWLEDYAEKNLAPHSLRCYKQMIYDRIIPALGHIKLNRLQPNHLLEFYNNLAEPGIKNTQNKKQGYKKEESLSSSTIQKYHRVISSILTSAVQWQLILNNSASRVKPPKVQRDEATAFNEHQVALLIEALDKQPLKYKTLIMLALVTGLRKGELVALQWKNIDFKNCTIEVKHSAQYLPGEGISLKDPKTKSSIRKVAVPASIISLLESLQKEQKAEKLKIGDLWNDNGWIFTQWNGEIMHVDTPYSWFKKFLESYNRKIKNDEKIKEEDKKNYLLPVISFHSLRHTAATLLIHNGLNVRAISSRLGHSNTSTTLNIYSHALQSADKEAANIMENILIPGMKTDIKQA